MPTQDEQDGRLALIVASSEYRDPTLKQLRAPGRDACDLAEVLGDSAIGMFEVRTLIDTPTDQLMRDIARFCNQAGPSDLLLVYLSCHGILDDRGCLYYAAIDTERDLLSATAVAAQWLTDQLDDSRARRKVLLLDCCHSGAFAKGRKGDSALALKDRFSGRGNIVLTASRATEYSFEGASVIGEGVGSVFTRAIVDGLRTGQADRDKDGRVTVDDLYHYVYDTVRAAEPRQTPELWAYGAEGDLLVARSPRGPIVEPAPLPGDLKPAPQKPEKSGRPQPEPRKKVWKLWTSIAAAVVAAGLIAALIIWHPWSPNAVSVYSGDSYGFNHPLGIAVDGTHVWVANYGGGSVTELNASNGSWERTLYGFNEPGRIAVDGTHIWVPNSSGDSVTELNASDGSWVRTLSGGSYRFNSPWAIAVDGTDIWVANQGGSVTELNASNGSWVRPVRRQLRLQKADCDRRGRRPCLGRQQSRRFGDGTEREQRQLGPDTVRGSYRFNAPWAMAVDGTHVWVTNWFGDSVTELNASNGRWVQTCPAAATASTSHMRSPWTAPMSGSPTLAAIR